MHYQYLLFTCTLTYKTTDLYCAETVSISAYLTVGGVCEVFASLFGSELASFSPKLQLLSAALNKSLLFLHVKNLMKYIDYNLLYFSISILYFKCLYVGYVCNMYILFVVSAYLLMNTIKSILNHTYFSVMLSISHHLNVHQYSYKSYPLSLTSCKTVWRNPFLCLDAYRYICAVL